MGRPKGSKNKPKAKPPDWLRKAMAVPPRRKGRPPGKSRPKESPTPQTLKRGKKPMATSKDKPFYDPMDDPDLRAPDPKNPQLDQSLPPQKPSKGTPLVLEAEPEPTPLYDEVAAGEAIPYDNAEMLIAGTLGGGGDHHADAKRILGRMVEANWLLTKGTEGSAAGMAIKSRKEAEAKRAKETAAKAKKESDGRDEWDHRDAKGSKAAKEGEDARG